MFTTSGEEVGFANGGIAALFAHQFRSAPDLAVPGRRLAAASSPRQVAPLLVPPSHAEAVACGGVSAVVFDMDGTLIDSTSCVTAAYRDAVLAAGGEQYTANEVVALYPKGPPRTILGLLLRRVATARDERLYLDALQRHRSSIAVYDGVIDVLEMLVAASVPIAVFTGASSTAARQLLADAGLLDFFAFVLGSDAVTRPKPAPDGILRACALLAVAPVNAAYVGDSPLDLEAARRSGALAIAAGWGHLFDPTANSDLVAMSPREVLQCLKAL